jgi:hypothetical protein
MPLELECSGVTGTAEVRDQAANRVALRGGIFAKPDADRFMSALGASQVQPIGVATEPVLMPSEETRHAQERSHDTRTFRG